MTGFVVVSLLARVPSSEAIPIVIYQASLDGAQAGVNTTATGQATVSIDLATNVLTFAASWNGLSANIGALHIHCCLPTSPTTFQQALALTNPLVPAVTTGSFTGTVLLPDGLAAGFRNVHGDASLDDFLAGLAAGTAYVDIPNMSFGGGEIRGALVPVPEPATATLLIAGLTALAVRGRYWLRTN